MSKAMVPAAPANPAAMQLKTYLSGLTKSLADAIPATLSRTLTPDRLVRIVLSEANKPDSKLLQCTPASIAQCLTVSAQLGLEPISNLGYFYLIPRNTRMPDGSWGYSCSYQIGYKGYIALGLRSDDVRRVNANAFYLDEINGGLFEGSIEPPEIKHKFSVTTKTSPESLAGSYCVVELRNGGMAQVILNRYQIEAHRDRSDGWKAFAAKKIKDNPWNTDFEAMARKTAIRALFSGGTVPLSAELAEAMRLDQDFGAIDTTASPAPAPAPAPQQTPAAIFAAAIAPQEAEVIPEKGTPPPKTSTAHRLRDALRDYSARNNGVWPDCADAVLSSEDDIEKMPPTEQEKLLTAVLSARDLPDEQLSL